MIEETERAPFRVYLAFVQLSSNGNISDGRIHPAPTVYLKDSACRNRTDSSDIPRTTRINVVRTIEASHHVRITKSTNQSLRDAIVLYRSQRGINRLHFTPV